MHKSDKRYGDLLQFAIKHYDNALLHAWLESQAEVLKSAYKKDVWVLPMPVFEKKPEKISLKKKEDFVLIFYASDKVQFATLKKTVNMLDDLNIVIIAYRPEGIHRKVKKNISKENVKVFPKLEREEYLMILRKARVCFHLVDKAGDTFAVRIFEAGAYMPVVSTGEESTFKWTCLAENVDEAVELIKKLFEDDDLWEKCYEKCYSYASKFTLKIFLEKWREFFSNYDVSEACLKEEGLQKWFG